jgi:ubiquinone/menaquinone biosynthesis C-methylase UbiE/class 3 adenylate cyclase
MNRRSNRYGKNWSATGEQHARLRPEDVAKIVEPRWRRALLGTTLVERLSKFRLRWCADVATRVGVIVFTDIVGSTDRDRRVAVAEADARRRTHFDAAAAVVAARNGRIVKALGDGLMIEFASASAAVDCAVALQQMVTEGARGERDPTAVRIGISAGEITAEDGDCFGLPVVEAARLCAEAAAGEILLADVVASLSRSLPHPTRPLGTRMLKGLDAPVAVHAVEWHPLVPAGGPSLTRIDAELRERAAPMLDHIASAGHMRAIRDFVMELLAPQPGETIADVGCGTGEDVRELWEIVGAGGRVVGVDLSEVMVEEAKRRAVEGGYDTAEFVLGDAARLDLPDSMFDGVRCDRVFQYVLDPDAAMRHLVRIVRPGGRVVVADTDWETAVFDLAGDDVSQRISRSWLDTRPNGRSGQQLFGLAITAGLTDVGVYARTNVKTDFDDLYRQGVVPAMARSAVDAGAVTSEEASGWVARLERRAAEGTFFRAFTTFVVHGRVARNWV